MAEGRTRLRDWIERSKLTQRAAAEMLGIHYTFLSQLLNNDRTPALATAVRIERVTGIPAAAWLPTDVDEPIEAVQQSAGKPQIGQE